MTISTIFSPNFTHIYYIQVYVLGTATRAGDPKVHEELRSLAPRYRGVLLLFDPDVAGRQGRNILTAALPEVWHAFVPTPVAVAAEAVGFKEAGNVGVEHATPVTLRRVLSRRRRSEPGRTEFSREEMQELGLIAVVQERVSFFVEATSFRLNF